MEILLSLIGLILGLGIGAFVGFLMARAKSAAMLSELTAAKNQLVEESRRAESLDRELRNALESKARAEQSATRVPELERRLDELGELTTQQASEIAQLKEAQKADKEKIAWSENAEKKLREAFESLAGKALQTNAEEFLKSARSELNTVLANVRGDWNTQRSEMKNLVQPLEKTLQTLDAQIRELEQKREGAYKGLDEQLRQLGHAQTSLQTATIKLEQALTSSVSIRGNWGQVAMRRVVELAQLESRVTFDEQASTDDGRPDMVVYLPNQSVLPVDAKATTIQYFQEAMAATDEKTQQAKLELHAKLVKERVRNLSQKKYWDQFERSPDCVVMFMPTESALTAAFKGDPDLLEYSLQQKVLLVTPVTLLALLKAVAYGWQQVEIAQNAQHIADLGKELHSRLSKFTEHLQKTGSGLDSAVKSYNEAVGSLENRVLPSARKFKELGVVAAELPPPALIERQARQLPPVEQPDN